MFILSTVLGVNGVSGISGVDRETSPGTVKPISSEQLRILLTEKFDQLKPIASLETTVRQHGKEIKFQLTHLNCDLSDDGAILVDATDLLRLKSPHLIVEISVDDDGSVNLQLSADQEEEREAVIGNFNDFTQLPSLKQVVTQMYRRRGEDRLVEITYLAALKVIQGLLKDHRL